MWDENQSVEFKIPLSLFSLSHGARCFRRQKQIYFFINLGTNKIANFFLLIFFY